MRHLFKIALFILIGGFVFQPAMGQVSQADNQLDARILAAPSAFLEEREAEIEEFQASYEAGDVSHYAVMQKRLVEQRSDLTQLIDTYSVALVDLENRQTTLTADIARLNNGEDALISETGEAVLSLPEMEISLSDVTRQIETLKPLILQAQIIRRDFDALANLVNETIAREGLQLRVDDRRSAVEAATRRLGDATSDDVLLGLREDLRALRTVATEDIAPIRTSRDRLYADLERLGEPPIEGGAAEAEEIVAERAKLSEALAVEDAIVRQSELNMTDIRRLLSEIAQQRRDLFYTQIFTRGPTLLSSSLISSAQRSAVAGLETLSLKRRGWRAQHLENGDLVRTRQLIGFSFVFALLLIFPLRHWLSNFITARLRDIEPTPGRRAWVAAVRIIARVLPVFIGGFIVSETLRVHGVIDDSTQVFAQSVGIGLLSIFAVEATASAIFAPTIPGWRLVPLEKTSGVYITTIIVVAVSVFFIDYVIDIGSSVFGGNQELAFVQSAICSIILGLLIILGCRDYAWQLEENRQDAVSDDLKSFGGLLKRVLPLVGGIVILASLIGYVAFAHYTATRIILLGGLIIGGLLFRMMAQEALHVLDRKFQGAKKAATPEADGGQFVFFWIGAFVDLVLFLALLPLAALAVGTEWADVSDGINKAFFGFQVGSVTISFAQIFAAILTFIVILGITRFVQRAGEKRFFPKTRMDSGVQNSLKTMIGYVGLLIAIMTGISVLGFNLQNLAIIAGALSVGIGFGLQSIVNNFVSGLILLFERPIKVGDWIVVSGGEGTVKRISVRSTEIETFDRSSVIVPNSELISSSVKNWTHKDRWTRLTVPVGVSYNCKPKEVLELLNEVLKNNTRIMQYPEPVVFFGGFGESSLDFELRVFLRDLSDRIPAQNELRVEVFEALRAANIEIPFPQRDLHVRSMPDALTGA